MKVLKIPLESSCGHAALLEDSLVKVLKMPMNSFVSSCVACELTCGAFECFSEVAQENLHYLRIYMWRF